MAMAMAAPSPPWSCSVGVQNRRILSMDPIIIINSTTSLKTKTLSQSHQFRPSSSSSSFSNAAASAGFAASEALQKEEEEEEEEGDGSRLYVGNLPYAITCSQLTDLFAEVGPVSSVEIVYDRVTDRSRGFAFVTMANVEDAKEAIRMFDGSQVGGRTVKVNFPEVPRGRETEVMGPKIRATYKGFIDTPYKIYAGNLPWTLTSQGLRDTFANLSGFLSAKVIYDRDFARSKGFGFVSFASAQDAQSALNAMDGKEVQGRPLRLNSAAKRATTVSSEP